MSGFQGVLHRSVAYQPHEETVFCFFTAKGRRAFWGVDYTWWQYLRAAKTRGHLCDNCPQLGALDSSSHDLEVEYGPSWLRGLYHTTQYSISPQPTPYTAQHQNTQRSSAYHSSKPCLRLSRTLQAPVSRHGVFVCQDAWHELGGFCVSWTFGGECVEALTLIRR